MPLSALLEEDFFNSYIKTGTLSFTFSQEDPTSMLSFRSFLSHKLGNILMLSEGRPGVDDKYCLKNGILLLVIMTLNRVEPNVRPTASRPRKGEL